ncbi:uncharacterized protein N7496_000796 [Penicillium cataractarum]|uniref:Zn(2)-C6 fungal-type domain-containing protein n=1 Tax=Penicillium cataractarum TaxID=2100454 RepID=A0A9W9VUV6_9EURO|nr:uncharacterized protein N7496_000796 [Penicillium cataractarum]KAJ5389728.1 hypothetical protein N7496_000796 [Penicillium cataractarum]
MNGTDQHQSPPSNPRKRRRPALSCQQCRARKIKCDKEMPCGPCTKAHGCTKCSYVHEGKAALDARLETSRGSVYGSPTSPVGSNLASGNGTSVDALGDAARIAKLESSVRALHDRLSSLETQVKGSENGHLSSHGNSSSMHNLNGLNERIAELERLSPPGKSGESDPPQTTIPPLAPRLKSIGERTRLFGTTHWALIFHQLRLLRQVRNTANYTDGNQNDISRLLGEVRGLRRIIKSRQAPQLADPAPNLLNDLPSRDVCDELVRNYFRTLGLIYQVMHIPSFYQEYERFWENSLSASTGFVRKLLLMLAIGSVFYCKPGPSNELGLPIRRWIYAAQWWISGPFEKERESIEGLQVHCLLLLCRQAYAMDKESNWTAAGTLLRQAIHQGLHRDPKHFPAISPFDAEMRRRIWASILEINVQFSIDAAMPPLLTPEDYDTCPPANLGDDDFDQSTTDIPPPQPKKYYTTSSLQSLLCQSLPVRLRILRALNDCNNEQSYENALRLGADITTACKEMAALFHIWLSRTGKSMIRPTQFHHQLMDTILRRFLLNLYRPFTTRSAQDPRFYLSRKLSLDSALILASYADPSASFDADETPYQDFQRLCLSGAGVFKGCLSLDIIIVISLELITQLEEEVITLPSGPVSLPPEAVDPRVSAAHKHFIHALERIKGQLYQGLDAGIPSMKRYCLLVGILAQIQAVPRGEQAEWTHIREAFIESMKTCRKLLQHHMSNEPPATMTDGTILTPADGVCEFTPESAIGSSLESEFMISVLMM